MYNIHRDNHKQHFSYMCKGRSSDDILCDARSIVRFHAVSRKCTYKPYLIKVNHLTGNYLIRYYNYTLALQVSMAVIARLLPKNQNVAGSNPSLPFFNYFIYKLYLYPIISLPGETFTLQLKTSET